MPTIKKKYLLLLLSQMILTCGPLSSEFSGNFRGSYEPTSLDDDHEESLVDSDTKEDRLLQEQDQHAEQKQKTTVNVTDFENVDKNQAEDNKQLQNNTKQDNKVETFQSIDKLIKRHNHAMRLLQITISKAAKTSPPIEVYEEEQIREMNKTYHNYLKSKEKLTKEKEVHHDSQLSFIETSFPKPLQSMKKVKIEIEPIKQGSAYLNILAYGEGEQHSAQRKYITSAAIYKKKSGKIFFIPPRGSIHRHQKHVWIGYDTNTEDHGDNKYKQQMLCQGPTQYTCSLHLIEVSANREPVLRLMVYDKEGYMEYQWDFLSENS